MWVNRNTHRYQNKYKPEFNTRVTTILKWKYSVFAYMHCSLMQYHYYSTHSGPFMLSTISHPMRCTKANREQACIKLRKARFSQLLNSSMKNYETQLKMYLKSFSRSYLGKKVNTAPFVCIPRFFSSMLQSAVPPFLNQQGNHCQHQRTKIVWG